MNLAVAGAMRTVKGMKPLYCDVGLQYGGFIAAVRGVNSNASFFCLQNLIKMYLK